MTTAHDILSTIKGMSTPDGPPYRIGTVTGFTQAANQSSSVTVAWDGEDDSSASFPCVDSYHPNFDRVFAVHTGSTWLVLGSINGVTTDLNFVGQSGQPAFQNSWVNYGGAFAQTSFWLDSSGSVHIQGLIKSGTVGGSVPVFTLPVLFRPSLTHIFNQNCSNGVARVDVNSSGYVMVQSVAANGNSSGTNGYVSLDGVSFLVAS